MKKLIILILALIPIISNCKKENEAYSELQIREIAWYSLGEQEKLTVNVDWKQAPVSESTFYQKRVYAVRFNTTNDALLGPIVVYVDVSTKVVVGYATRF
ncbi:MAG: hypothetical protein WCP85_00405 [Mariniphaga sp.]